VLIQDEKKPAQKRTPTILSTTLPVKLTLAGSVVLVNAGTPLREKDGAWIIARDGMGEFVAQANAYGGESVHAIRGAAVEFHEPLFEPGLRYRVSDVDDRGRPEFVPDPRGPFVAATRTVMLMDMTYVSLLRHARSMVDSPGS